MDGMPLHAKRLKKLSSEVSLNLAVAWVVVVMVGRFLRSGSGVIEIWQFHSGNGLIEYSFNAAN